MCRFRCPDRTTTSAVITLVMLAIGRWLYCLRPHSCLPVIALASSAARAAIEGGGCAGLAVAVLAAAGLIAWPPRTTAAATARQPAAGQPPWNRRDRGMALLGVLQAGVLPATRKRPADPQKNGRPVA